MRKEKDFDLKSDKIGYFVISFPNKVDVLDMGEAENYKCHIVFDNESEIPECYAKCGSGNHWCKLYDDTGAVMVIHGENIDIYRVGERTVLVHSYGESDGWVESFVDTGDNPLQ